jgi:hypothetical protein
LQAEEMTRDFDARLIDQINPACRRAARPAKERHKCA